MNVKDKVTINTEKFLEEYSSKMDASDFIAGLKGLDGVIYLSVDLLNVWQANVPEFINMLNGFDIPYRLLKKARGYNTSFYGIVIGPNASSLLETAQLYINTFKEGAGKTVH